MLAKAILLFGSAQAATVLAALVRSKVAALTVGPTGVGLMALFTTITTFVATVVSFGLGSSAVQLLSKTYATGDEAALRRDVSLVRSWSIITGFVGMAIMLVASPIICTIYFGHWNSHLNSVILLSIVPPSLIISQIEGAILKSLQQRRRLTISLIVTAMITITVAVPLFVTLGWSGIPFIVASSSFLSACAYLCLGWKTCDAPFFTDFLRHPRKLIDSSRSLFALGLAFVVSSICFSGTDLILQSYVNTISDLTYVGLFKAGYQLAISYPALIFTAIENDYYPRLSAVAGDINARNTLIRRQISTTVTIVTPLIIVFILLLPWIVPLLLSEDFNDIIPMVTFGALSIIVRGAYLPLAYLPIALQRSKDYIHLEIVSAIGIIAFAIIGCKIANLTGIGAGLLASQIFDVIYIYIFCKRKYGV